MLPSGRTQPWQAWSPRSWSETRQDWACQNLILDLGGAHRALELPVERLASDEFCGKDSNQFQNCAHFNKLLQAHIPKRAPVKLKVLEESRKTDINVENNFYGREGLIRVDYKVAGVVVGSKLQNLLNTYMNLSKSK